MAMNDMTTSEKAFAESCQRELINADSLLAIYNHQNSNLPEVRFNDLPNNLPEVQKYNTNFQVYDLLLKGDSHLGRNN